MLLLHESVETARRAPLALDLALNERHVLIARVARPRVDRSALILRLDDHVRASVFDTLGASRNLVFGNDLDVHVNSFIPNV
jgi:hypothetical protein